MEENEVNRTIGDGDKWQGSAGKAHAKLHRNPGQLDKREKLQTPHVRRCEHPSWELSLREHACPV